MKCTVSVLSSGSSGNSIHMSLDDTSILIDAGISCRMIERRMDEMGLDPEDVKTVFLTHEHTDHTRGAKRFCSKYETPLYATQGTLSLTPLDGVQTRVIGASDISKVGDVTIRSFPIRHFAAEPVAYSISADGTKIGMASDLGCVTKEVIDSLKGSDILLIEANYDDKMLLTGSYPDFLKKTIRSDHGHLSNDDAAALCSATSTSRTKRVVLLHLSKENNTPHKADSAVRQRMRADEIDAYLDVTDHGCTKGPIRL